MSTSNTLDCNLLTSYESFDEYIESILNVTGDNLHRVEGCKTEVCGALWGVGNADISGKGVSIRKIN